jgi:hypothetical protein
MPTLILMKYKVPKPIESQSTGQALLEFVVSSVLCAIAICGTLIVFRDQWVASRCAYLIFEETHSQLTGRKHSLSHPEVKVSDREEWIRGEGRSKCKNLSHPLELHKLERITW